MTNRKILVALDKSKQAEKVLQTALDVVTQNVNEIKLFHCINSNLMVREVSSIGGIGTIGDINIYGNLHKKYQEELNQEIQKVSNWSEYYCEQVRMRKIHVTFTYEIGIQGRKFVNLLNLGVRI